MVQEKKHRVVVVGGGIAGLASAIFLSDVKGVEVTLLESQSKLGGIFRTMYTSTMFYYPKREEMGELERKLGKQYIDDFHADLVAAVTKLEEKRIVRGKYLSGFKNYEGNEEIYNTYALDLCTPVTKKVVKWGYKLVAPRGSFQLFVNELKAGNNVFDISDTLKKGAQKSGAKIVLKCRVKSVQGSSVMADDGREFQFDSLILASGGMGSNVELTKKVYGTTFVPHEFNKINDGLSLKSALQKKWRYNKSLMAWFTEAIRLNSGTFAPVLFLSGPAVMVVDSKGNRVYDEKLVYNIRGKTTAKYGELILVSDRRNVKRYVTDTVFIPKKYGPAVPPPRSQKHVKAKSVRELCQLLKADENFKVEAEFETNFQKQFEQYQSFARKGKDTSFNRGEQSGEVLDTDRLAKTPNRAMMPLDESRLVALKLHASTLGTCSGPVVDKDSRVVQEDGSSVSNIYAVGNCSASILGGNYVAPGVPVSAAIVGALRTCRAIKKEIS